MGSHQDRHISSTGLQHVPFSLISSGLKKVQNKKPCFRSNSLGSKDVGEKARKIRGVCC